MVLKLLKISVDICWYLALALPLLSLLPPWGLWIFWGLPAAYAVALLISRRGYGSHGGNQEVLKWQGGLLLGGSLLEWWILGAKFGEESLIFLCLFLALGVLLLRISRLGEETQRDRGFWLRNGAHMALVVVLVLLATSRLFLGSVSQVGHFLYTYVLSPLVLGLAWVVGKGMEALLGAISSVLPQVDPETFAQGLSVPDTLNLEELNFEETQIPPALTYIAWAILGIGAVFALVFIFKKLTSAAWAGRKKEGAAMVKSSLPPLVRKRESGWAGDPVRGYYRRFLRLCKRSGISLSPQDSSEEIQEKAASLWEKEALSPLRELYLQARYGTGSSRKAAALARREYHKIKGLEKHSGG